MKGIVIGCSIPFLLALAATVARAEWGGPTTIYLGVEATKDTSPQCYSNGVNDRLTSNIGVRQQVWSRNQIGVLANYTHHSCAINIDREGYDAIGIQLEWRID